MRLPTFHEVEKRPLSTAEVVRSSAVIDEIYAHLTRLEGWRTPDYEDPVPLGASSEHDPFDICHDLLNGLSKFFKH